MSGHSKWSTIKRKKGEKDSARANVFTKISREIIVCIKDSGVADPNNNSKLRELINKARGNNIPNDNIDRLLKKAAGGQEKNDYERCVYEGYGPSGVAVMVECLTDNRNRTAGEIRHFFDKSGGSMGVSGCVSFLFEQKGLIVIDSGESTIDSDKLMEISIELGADDISVEDSVAEIYTDSSSVGEIADGLRKAKYNVVSAEVAQIPSTSVALSTQEHKDKMEKLLDSLEDNDDVQNVWHNYKED